MERVRDAGALQELEAAVVFVDVVESMRLLEEDERQAIQLLRELLSSLIDKAVLPLGGKVIERQGDGLLLQFEQVVDAVLCAMAMHELALGFAPLVNHQGPIQLRVGIHSDLLLTDSTLLYGRGVNLAARVLQVAGAGEIVVTNPVRDALTDDVDVRIEDLGYCYLKHWDSPIRLWRVWPLQPLVLPSVKGPGHHQLEPDARLSIAVLHFEGTDSLDPGLGDFLNAALVAAMVKQPSLRVSSPLSATRLKGGLDRAAAGACHLGVRYVLTGSVQQMGRLLVVNPQLVDAHDSEVVWADQIMAGLDEWMQPSAQPVQRILEDCIHALSTAHIKDAQHRPLPQLDSHALMSGAVSLMHRASGTELHRSEAMLHAVIERHRRVAAPRAWLAKWHVLSLVQGSAPDPQQAISRAIEAADRALDVDADSALALAVKGHALCHQGLKVDEAFKVLDAAIHSNPSEASAWLYRSVWHHMWGRPDAALEDALVALQLSPLDPQRAQFEMVLGIAYLVAHDLGNAIQTFGSSVLRNRCHLPALRGLMTAQYEAGYLDEARVSLQRVKALAPQLTAKQFLSTGASSPIRQRVAKALIELGVDHS